MSRRLVPVVVVLAVAAALAAWFGLRAQAAQRHLEAARTQLTTAKDALLDRRIDDATRSIALARRNTSAARGLTGDPLWRLGAAVPVLGASLQSVRGVTTAVDEIADGVLPPGLTAASALAEGQLKDDTGAIDVDLVSSTAEPLATAADRLQRARDRLAALPTTGVVGTVAAARDELSAQLADLAGAVDTADRVVRLAPTLLGQDRPRRYFVLVQQPGESRGTGGLPGGYAVVQTDKGKVTVTASGPNSDLQQGTIPLPEGVSEDYAFEYAGNRALELWQNVNLSPDLPTVAKVVAARWKVQSGQDVDGVITLDPLSIRDLVRGGGPVDVGDGKLVQPDDLVQYLTVGQYVGVPLTPQGTLARKDNLAEAAKQASTRLSAPDSDPDQLLRGIRSAVQSGHMHMAGTVPELQDGLHELGVDGALPDGQTPVAYPVVENATQGKLDSFLERSVTYTAGPCDADGQRETTIAVTLRNDAPAGGLPPYLTIRSDGPDVADVQSTDSAVILQTYASSNATLVSAELDGTPVTATDQQELDAPGTGNAQLYQGLEGELPFFSLYVDLPRGQARTVVLHLTEPDLGSTVTIPEQPLVRPMQTKVSIAPC